MNILLTTETYLPYITGVSISTDSIARYMVSRGHKVVLITPQPLIQGDLIPLEGLTIVHVPSLPFTFYNNNALALIPFSFSIVSREMKKTKFDVVHIQESGLTGVPALILAKKHHIPVVGSLHFIAEQIDRVLFGKFERLLTPVINLYIRLIWMHYDAIMTVSNFFANNLRKIGVTKPIFVISNGVDVEKFHPEAGNKILRKRLGFSEDDLVLFFLGRIDKDKNVETLIRAMPYTDLKIKLLIVGKGSERKSLQKLSRKLGVKERITWIDYITDSEMIDYYHAADIFSIMSPYEGQSIVTLQAVASGLPVIACGCRSSSRTLF